LAGVQVQRNEVNKRRLYGKDLNSIKNESKVNDIQTMCTHFYTPNVYVHKGI